MDPVEKLHETVKQIQKLYKVSFHLVFILNFMNFLYMLILVNLTTYSLKTVYAIAKCHKSKFKKNNFFEKTVKKVIIELNVS